MLPFLALWAALWWSARTSALQKVTKREPRRVTDPKEDWYGVKVPVMFSISNIGTALSQENSRNQNCIWWSQGSVFEVSLTDLQNDDIAFRKFRLMTEDVQDKNRLTNFPGMDLICDKMCSIVKKWQIFCHDWSLCWCQDYKWVSAPFILCWFY